MGYPFLEDSYTLSAIDTTYVIKDTVVEVLATAHSLRKEQFKTFYELHICNESNKLITDTIPQNKLNKFTKNDYKQNQKINLSLTSKRLKVNCLLKCISLHRRVDEQVTNVLSYPGTTIYCTKGVCFIISSTKL